jgi:hypothetical protein
VRFSDGDSVIGTSSPVDVPVGKTRQVSVTWDTRTLRGERSVTAVVDPDDTVPESNEADNALTRTITVRGNKVQNGSFEESADGSAPDAWEGGSGTAYDTSGAHASDGEAAVGLKGGLLGNRWTSAPVEVAPGETYGLALTFTGTAPAVSVSFLDGAGSALGTTSVPVTGLTGELTGRIDVPLGASALRIGLAGGPNLLAGQTTWVDEVWLW